MLEMLNWIKENGSIIGAIATIMAAIIGAIATIMAAIIGGVFLMRSKSDSRTPISNESGNQIVGDRNTITSKENTDVG